jgi:two-component system, OmpR family, KDP operon response regulator KdpE
MRGRRPLLRRVHDASTGRRSGRAGRDKYVRRLTGSETGGGVAATKKMVGMIHAERMGTRRHGPSASDQGTPGPSRGVMPLVLVVEDDRRMLAYLRAMLSDQRFRIIDADTGTQAIAQAATHNPDFVVLDLGLPDMDGIEVTARLREWTAVPILVVSARHQESEKVAALDAGANDYLTKPFGTGELLARMRVWLRQAQRTEADALTSVLDVGELRIDFSKRLAFARGREVRLTPTQYKLFGILMRNAGKVLTHEQILSTVWGPAYTKETQYLRVYMAALRQKFEKDPARPRYLVTEPGIGYRLRLP